MKRNLITLAIVLLAMAAQAQIKLHSNGRITFQTLANTTTQGVSIGPAPNWNVDFNGKTFFHEGALFVKDANNYEWMNAVHTVKPHSASWVIAYPEWDNSTFFVYGNGDAYARNHYTITSSSENAKDSENIQGEKALSIISRLIGYYFEAEQQEIPDLENNEIVVPEAIETMYADFGKRTAGLSGSNLEKVFPEAVRTEPNNRLCIDYQSVVTMLVEAVKEQQREIEELHSALEKLEKTSKTLQP